jgi:hypothetical protein
MWVLQLDGRGAARVIALLVVLVAFVPLMPALLVFSLIPGQKRASELLDKLNGLITEILCGDAGQHPAWPADDDRPDT